MSSVKKKLGQPRLTRTKAMQRIGAKDTRQNRVLVSAAIKSLQDGLRILMKETET